MSSIKNILFKCFIISILFFCSTIHAEPTLTNVQKEIQTVKKDLQTQHSSRSKLEKKLKKSEERLSKLKSTYHQTQKDLKKQTSQLNVLNKAKEDNETKLTLQQEEMSNQIRAAYMSGDSKLLKVLLNQKNIADVQKNLAYYRYFLKQRADLINALQLTMNEIETNTKEIESKTKTFSKLKSKQQSEIKKIQATQAQRNQTLEDIDATIATNSDRLAILNQNRQGLETVVKKLKTKTKYNSKKQYQDHGSFNKGKGKMTWPAKGKITAGYNSKIEGSQLKLNGVLISAPQGENVHAISSGKVVFSQWMSGYGLLVIVDHSDGYMTLYGRNDVVYRKVGDTVSAGDILATVGNSGGYNKPALYFAVRKDSKPLNPKEWCSA